MIAKDFIKDIQKINEFASILDKDTLSNIDDYISTGSLVLDSVISGSFNKGIPAGRITALVGLSGTGKSLVAAKIVANAIKKGYTPIWFDSEFSTDHSFLANFGVDTSQVIKLPVATIEEFKLQCFKLIEIYSEKYKGKKIMIVLDSLGNLASQKSLDDATNGKAVSDMGQRAKVSRDLFRVLGDKIGKLKIPFVVINHTYADPVNPYAEEKMSGGEGLTYNAHIIVGLKKSMVKDEDKQVIGTILKAKTRKNRIAPPFMSGAVLIDFKTGLDTYYGLLEDALEAGLVIKDGKRFKTVKRDKLEWEKNIYKEEFFGPIIDDLNKYLTEKNKYSTEIIIEEPIEDIVGEIDGNMSHGKRKGDE